MENYFFELPIYRCSVNKYYEDMEIMRNKILTDFPFLKDDKERMERIYYMQSYDYEYNEVIGWLKLYILGKQVRGEYHFEINPDNRNFPKYRFDKGIRKKRFEKIGKAFEISFHKNENSGEIYSKILEYIEYLMIKEKPFKGRFIDISKFEKIGKFVDWKNLLINLNPITK